MIDVDLQQLVNALDAPTRGELEASAERCVSRGSSKILVEDLLLALLERPEGMLSRALVDAEVGADELGGFLHPPIEHSATRSPAFSAELVQWLQDALLIANLDLGQSLIDQAALILALLRNPLRYAERPYQPLLAKINIERFRDYALAEQVPDVTKPSVRQCDSLLERFTHNLTQQARDGLLDPVLCRDDCLRQMIDILSRRRKNNPIVVGEAGVGKTAVVEGLALKIVHGEVPDLLENVELLSLDMGLLQAGASIKGEFERRLKGVIDEVKSSSRPVILFIDEAHTLIGDGAQARGSDAANLLKPALARGELRTIAATTWAEYRQYFEKDPALARRFQPVRVLEPTVEQAITILRGLAPLYERTHGVHLRDDAVVAAARLSARYLTGRQLPDKAIDLLDTACARARIGLVAVPERLEHLRSEMARQQRHFEAIRRDANAGMSVDDKAVNTLTSDLSLMRSEAAALEFRWTDQRAAVERLLELRKQLAERTALSADAGESESTRSLESELTQVRRTLIDIQMSDRLVSFEVCPRLIAEVVGGWTGIPVSRLAQEHSPAINSFSSELRMRIRGQEQAMLTIEKAVRASAAGLNAPGAPTGVFLLVGPSGVGKTETAIALADLLYGGERFLTTINMSEFQEKHTVSRLIGAPPGYIGYGEGGMLTDAVRCKPYSIILLDEVEKADPDVLNLFYQIFDKGTANDGEGREIDFRNTLILMTSNLGADLIHASCHEGRRPDVTELKPRLKPILSAHFKPALLARMRVVPYYPIMGAALRELVELKLIRLGERLESRGLTFSYSHDLVCHLLEQCTQDGSGARLIDQLLESSLTPLIADRLLDAMSRGDRVVRVHATLDSSGGVVCEFE
ncbi:MULTISPECIES: type VI secretion system ATPase TssH [Pseudomonas]|uniref:type VI secretion system ATPase TssH n=1 Tax=Pseudomonas TaxID=286 RepID=UPI000CDA2A89|nr:MULTISPECIES: type VI secretion system ATPase TssH [Pseudomonas]MBC8881501.1 type VI secretion system ATPase TssH [Pseudomonas cerasi]MBC9747997.1 type VI secretion system ATPase TssH [Pseudomonas syringae pv. syringae]MCK9695753.1 type VI secretion system ATPase TssH [Pseudomonas syringae pv. syringae]MCK9720453.1 type VI secretion system ATPase TssH [Pseudomonas syringae pv. syringae]MCK9727212.1 type VI secretion system ATPase TssH [Pseudomonas syringae pv. syringae]